MMARTRLVRSGLALMLVFWMLSSHAFGQKISKRVTNTSFTKQGSPTMVGKWGLNSGFVWSSNGVGAKDYYSEYDLNSDGTFVYWGKWLGETAHFIGEYRLPGDGTIWITYTGQYDDNRNTANELSPAYYIFDMSKTTDGWTKVQSRSSLAGYYKDLWWDFGVRSYRDASRENVLVGPTSSKTTTSPPVVHRFHQGFVFQLKGTDDQIYTVSFGSDNRRVEVTKNGSDAAAVGDRVLHGSFFFSVASAGHPATPQRQVSPFVGSHQGDFNLFRRLMYVVKSGTNSAPDILAIEQYDSSNINDLKLFFVDKGLVKPITFIRPNSKPGEAVPVSGGLFFSRSGYSTHFYRNDIGKTDFCDWTFDQRKGQFLLTSEIKR